MQLERKLHTLTRHTHHPSHHRKYGWKSKAKSKKTAEVEWKNSEQNLLRAIRVSVIRTKWKEERKEKKKVIERIVIIFFNIIV